MNPVIFLMTICAILMLIFQLYFNLDAYQNNQRVFKASVDGALKTAVTKLMNVRRDEFASQYKKWLLDTSKITLGLKLSAQDTLFSIQDKIPIDKTPRPPFTLNLPQLNVKSTTLTPTLRNEFVNYFVKNFLYNDFATGRVLFFTTSLGEKQREAFAQDKVNLKRLEQIYRRELQTEKITAPFTLQVKNYNFTKFDSLERDSLGKDYVTHPNTYGFGQQVSITATFPNVSKANLEKMKWLIFSSLVLMAITIFCFAYTLKMMFSQKRLSMLKDDFVNNMTHELKTPVATISIAAEAIADFEADKNQSMEYLSIIRSQAKNITNLIEKLLNSMLAEQDSLSLKLEKLSFNDLLCHVLQQHQPQFQLEKATVKSQITHESLFVTGDQTSLNHMLANLIDNAIKYSKGTPDINIILRKQKKELIFTISNHTEEIPEIYANRLFEKFFRVPQGNLHDVKGYGLGLSYVAYIVKQHHGKITTLIQGEIITFTLILPIHELA